MIDLQVLLKNTRFLFVLGIFLALVIFNKMYEPFAELDEVFLDEPKDVPEQQLKSDVGEDADTKAVASACVPDARRYNKLKKMMKSKEPVNASNESAVLFAQY